MEKITIGHLRGMALYSELYMKFDCWILYIIR